MSIYAFLSLFVVIYVVTLFTTIQSTKELAFLGVQLANYTQLHNIQVTHIKSFRLLHNPIGEVGNEINSLYYIHNIQQKIISCIQVEIWRVVSLAIEIIPL